MTKLKVATCSLAGCFGCHMSLLDIDERILPLLELVEFDRSPLTDIKTVGHCDLGLIEGGLCNAENVQVLRDLYNAGIIPVVAPVATGMKDNETFNVNGDTAAGAIATVVVAVVKTRRQA